MEVGIKNFAYIGLGSNLGDTQKNIETALTKIDLDAYCQVETVSSFYESKPFGLEEQNNFFNAAALIETYYGPVQLLHFLKNLETEMGRTKSVKWGPRIIDIDILFYNDEVYSGDELTIPHKECMNRDFVYIPLVEIAPELIHPIYSKRISEISILDNKRHILKKIFTNSPVK